MTGRVAPSARIEAETESVLALDEPEGLAELGRLGARLVLQRGLEEEVTAFLVGCLSAPVWLAAGEREPSAAGADGRGRTGGGGAQDPGERR